MIARAKGEGQRDKGAEDKMLKGERGIERDRDKERNGEIDIK